MSRYKVKRTLRPEVRAKISASRKGQGVGPRNPHWRGGRVEVSGYMYVYSPSHPNRTQDGYVCEHRLAMEQHIGRLLDPGEAVHHRDGNRMNNAIENLELCASNGVHSVAHHVRRDRAGRFACA